MPFLFEHKETPKGDNDARIIAHYWHVVQSQVSAVWAHWPHWVVLGGFATPLILWLRSTLGICLGGDFWTWKGFVGVVGVHRNRTSATSVSCHAIYAAFWKVDRCNPESSIRSDFYNEKGRVLRSLNRFS